ncbi:gliding motility protein GldL [Flavobacterium branchiophilum NBRC 15030 = ATCC 35035]|uniref:Gliding motility transmembrane protein GldL n=2 Tax=Flavobacterium branchiophilum TaxID=55197 RepID=G2Z227_FLABF|nr:gliding motility protein GldL [Flavobacterium branchiophilum]OXA76767.1 gliding motility protein GldL [Flavobacterium branchiophilum NBRC 15030 = ATCC 35035]PDS24920.1 gliding motility protein GldL [Flavobacterium branchiophilum]TQM42461.1 protein involved in gliding motility GldL [Flavobacterium branchiophilum]CCB69975.1 Gliding motility transmembrane protein GldL [Flavobacterium branchiophilum FL-15]GEM54147.1 gliding motility protein GldL [Flavobacterium branchiophilum NBRC 15030 = ATCC 
MALINKKVMNFTYGMGAAVVIIGALFKIEHLPGASLLLKIGLITEAFIFALSAFEPAEKELDWSLVYPELAGGEAKKKDVKKQETPTEAQGLLSQKLDSLLKDAKIDGELMASLGNSIKNFESAAKGIAPTVDSIASTKKYSEELTLAASQMESLNSLYKLQLQSAEKNAQINEEVAANNLKLKDQMQSLTSNLTSLNNVYGGMLSAMSNK